MMIRDVPSYQIEVFPATGTDLPGEESMQTCSVYGGGDPRFKMCIDDADGEHGGLVIGESSKTIDEGET
jgi:hypothetical protein